MKRIRIATFLFTLASISVFSPLQGAGAINPEAIARKGIDQVINLEMNNARKTFASLGKQYPDYPLLPFLVATVNWAEAEVSHGDQRDRMKDKAISTMVAAVNKADRYIESHADDKAGIADQWRMTRGMANFFAARMYADGGHTLKAYRLGRAGRDELRGLIEKNPDMNDAYLVLGMYEYIAGSIPKGLRWLATLFDLRGDRDLGVRYLERASARAPVMAPEAARMLLVAAGILPETTRSCAYLPMAQYARNKYPGNPHYSIALQLLYVNCGYPEKALNETGISEKKFLEDFPNLAEEFRVIRVYAYRDQGDVKKIKAMKNQFKRDTSYWNLMLAQTYDVIGERKKAVSLYDDIYWADVEGKEIKTDSGPPSDWIIDRATRHRKEPYKPAVPGAGIVGSYLYMDKQKPAAATKPD